MLQPESTNHAGATTPHNPLVKLNDVLLLLQTERLGLASPDLLRVLLWWVEGFDLGTGEGGGTGDGSLSVSLDDPKSDRVKKERIDCRRHEIRKIA